ncbi:MAG: hypothetical protein ABIF88_03640 [archaeon]
MRRKSLVVLSILVSVGFIIFVNAGTMEDNNGIYTVGVYIEEGWNLVSGTVISDGIMPDSVVKLEDLKAMWYYSPIQQKYFQVYPETDWEGIMADDEDFALSNAMWVYSEKAGLLKYSTLEDYSSEERDLYAGWNLVSMTPDFLEGGKYGELTLEEISGNCNFEKVYYYGLGEWKEYNFAEMENSLLGRGLAIKVSQNCKMSYTGEQVL